MKQNPRYYHFLDKKHAVHCFVNNEIYFYSPRKNQWKRDGRPESNLYETVWQDVHGMYPVDLKYLKLKGIPEYV